MSSKMNCNCPCRHYIRCILRTFSRYDLIIINEFMDLNDAIQRMFYLSSIQGNYSSFEECLAANMANPADVFDGLRRCRCCGRHRLDREVLEYGPRSVTPPLTDYESENEL